MERTAIERLASSPIDFGIEALIEIAALMREEEPQADPEAIVTPLEAALRLTLRLLVAPASAHIQQFAEVDRSL